LIVTNNTNQWNFTQTTNTKTQLGAQQKN